MRITIYLRQAILLFVLLAIFQGQSLAQDLTDKSIKTKVSEIPSPLKFITSLEPKVFEYNTKEYSHLKLPSGTQYGFISEDFQQVFPHMVYKKPYSFMSGKNSYRNATVKTIDMESLVPVLIASIKEQQAQIEQLQAEVRALKDKR